MWRPTAEPYFPHRRHTSEDLQKPGKVGGDPIMSRVIAVVACGFTLAACSTSLESPRPLPAKQSLWIESQPPGAEAKTSLGPSCRTPCGLEMQTTDEFSLTLTLKG